MIFMSRGVIAIPYRCALLLRRRSISHERMPAVSVRAVRKISGAFSGSVEISVRAAYKKSITGKRGGAQWPHGRAKRSVDNSASLKGHVASGRADSFGFRVDFEGSSDIVKKGRARRDFVAGAFVAQVSSPLSAESDIILRRGKVRTVKMDARPVTGHYYAKSSLRRVIRVVVRHCFAAGARSPDNAAIFDSENHCNPTRVITQVP